MSPVVLTGAEPVVAWPEIQAQLGERVPGARILLAGPVPDAATASLAQLGAAQTKTCADPEQLDTDSEEGFDVVYCDGLLHRVREPLALLRRLRHLTRDGGTLVIGSILISDPERSEYLRFVPDRYAGDPSWWFVPGRLAFRWLVQSAGFEIEAAFGERNGTTEPFAVMRGYLRARAI